MWEVYSGSSFISRAWLWRCVIAREGEMEGGSKDVCLRVAVVVSARKVLVSSFVEE
jgi:hypothetical protein